MFDPNPLFIKMASWYAEAKKSNQKLIICNEGGTRSGKTYSTFDLIAAICDANRNKGLDIYILRDSLIHCRDFTLKDFRKSMQISGFWEESKYIGSPKPYYNLFGNNIYFRGLDDETSIEGYPSDILFFNELLECEKSSFDALKMRCRKLIIADWNPKLTQHWAFELEGQPNVKFTRTTYKDNKHLEQTIIDEIESYNPAIEKNVINKTANLFRWLVYGIGVRTDQEGNVFNDSQLAKFNLQDIDIKTGICLSYCDVADQGTDYLSFVVACIIADKTYIVDVIYTQKNSDYTLPLILAMFDKWPIQKAYFESNGAGLMFTKLIKTKLNKQDINKIIAYPESKNKHSRIVIQADINIIPTFYFLASRKGMYEEFYNHLTSYKHDKSFKIDDAPDSLAGLSFQISRIRK